MATATKASPGFVGDSSLERELQTMMRRAPQQRTPRTAEQIQRVAAPVRATETSRMEGIKLSGDRITIHGTSYSRAEFRAKLQEIVDGMQSDPASAYRDRNNPNHQQTVEEISLAYKFLNYELSPQDETAIVSEWHAAEEATEVATLQPFQEIAQIMGTPEGRVALQRARAGLELDARQKALVARHNELEAQNNAIALKERAVKTGLGKPRPHYVAPELYRIEAIKDPRERIHAIRAQRAAWRDDPNSAYNDVRHGDHKWAVENMQRLYLAESELPPQPEDES
jgi:hypothetical protein